MFGILLAFPNTTKLTYSPTLLPADINSQVIFSNDFGKNIEKALPASPVIGDTVRILDGSGHAGNGTLYQILIQSTGNIMGSASDLIISTGRAGITLVYYNTANGWILQEN